MGALILPKPLRKLLVIGPIYDQVDKLPYIKEMLPQYDWIIFNSGLFNPSNDIREIKVRIEQMNMMLATEKVIYVAGRSDLMLSGRLEDPEARRWISNLCNIVIADFPNRNVLIMDGGIPRDIKNRNELMDNLEVSFVSYFNDKPWHQSYNGRLGYVISNNPLTDQSPQYYNHSMQLGNLYKLGASVYAQEVDGVGLKRTILL